MRFFNRIEVRLSLLMVLVVVVTSLLTVGLNTYQRERTFRELPAEVRDILRRSDSRLPALGFPAELRDVLLSGQEIRVRLEPSPDPGNPNPVFVLSLPDGSGSEIRVQPPPRLRRPSLETRLQQNLLIASLAATGLGVLLALVFARRIARPIEAISDAAGRLAQGDLKARVGPQPGEDEVARLARNFDQMAEALERLEAERRAMIADIAHELRTPLTVMQGRLEAIQDGVLPLEMGEVDRLHQQARLLSRLVEDLRTLSLADAGRLNLTLQPLNLAELADRMAATFQAALEAKQITLERRLPKGPVLVRADPDRLAQVIGNLLSNALSHTPTGGWIGLEVAVEAAQARLRVLDSGPGIPEAALGRVFDRFYRAEASRSRATGGSGLGLSIVKALVELHKGTVTARNRPEGGAVFEVSLPLDQAG
ncbi:sensor histidine kinase [Meiothermus taiwanensis]|uniref:Signal transduction histidine-protein kinase/phosphatase MprB n=2 Tax=Meiothermus taiwanensis TaxID=172827 RepID=A0A399DVS8_9DEIN|nr:ATP-binding protein [Meiothermus taiwanensis]AWR85280.1 histidine kinase [Meiothermus taiwanensis WR-220]KIQ55757.1 histidine kinase [Meiothermus taiwanensis]KZK17045.1 two-component sensor histidine kinase [Meiothermus taiwanensis]RIH76285.1 Signal transduction histidine-protein kinase BaeS [Meiothermus taiwanensis]